jgi:exosortase A
MTTPALHTSKAAWCRALPPLAVLLIGVLLLYRNTFHEMVLIWLRSDTFAHCLLVWPISFWLIWRQRARLVPLSPQPAPWLLLPMLLLCALWLLGQLATVNAAMQLAVTALLVLSVFLSLGWQVTAVMLFPLGFMFFAVPMGEFLLPQFMTWTADFTVMALRLSGIAVYREGLQFVIPSGHWSVVEACSGIRYLMASVVVGTLFAYLNYRRTWRRCVFVGISILVPVVANWLRAYMIVMLGHLSGNELATGADHLVYGWVFFGVVMLLMFMVGARWREDDDVLTDAPESTATMTKVPQVAFSPARHWTLAALALLVMSLPPVWFFVLESHADSTEIQLVMPAELSSNWRRQWDTEPVIFKPDFQNPSAQFSAWYGLESNAVGLHISYYRQQDASRKLVSSLNVLVKSHDKTWLHLSSAQHSLKRSDGPMLTVNTTELRPRQALGTGPQPNLVVWHFYWVDEHFTSSDFLAKLYGAWGRFMGRPDDAAVLVFYAPRGAQDTAAAALERFAKDNLTFLQARLGEVRDRHSLPGP